MRTPVTLEEVQECVRLMHTGLPRYGLTPENLPTVARVYREALEMYDLEAVRGAMAMLLKTSPKFATPSAWVEMTRTWLKHNRVVLERQPETDTDGNDIVCRICRSVGRWAVLRLVPCRGSLPMTTPRVDHTGAALGVGETLRRISVCDPTRHRTPHGLTPQPDNFLRWES